MATKDKKSRYFEYKEKIRRSYGQLKKAYEEVQDSYAEMVFRMALVAEYKDDATGTHLVRIADYSTEIGRQMGLSQKDINYLKYASVMHDIGKLVVPDAILKKESGLTPEERELIKKHAPLGADIFRGSRSALLKVAKLICLTHHERYDGTGYPNGLKGKEIPLFGRIVALADVFDALTSRRPYKAAYGFNEAMEMIKEQSGKHFDPDVVKVFLSCRSKIKRIWQATQDIDSFVKEKAAELHVES